VSEVEAREKQTLKRLLATPPDHRRREKSKASQKKREIAVDKNGEK